MPEREPELTSDLRETLQGYLRAASEAGLAFVMVEAPKLRALLARLAEWEGVATDAE